MPSRPSSRSPGRRRRLDLAVGAAAVLVLFVAVPVVLAVLAGWPVPHRWDRAALVSRHTAFAALALVAWVGWAGCCATIVRSVVDILGAHRPPDALGSRLTDRVAVRIAAGVLVLGGIAGAGSAASATTPGGARASHVGSLSIRPPTEPVVGGWAPPPAPAPSPAPGATAPGAAAAEPETGGGTSDDATVGPTVPPTYQVASGDSLWSIASQLYGDGADWAAIARVNLGRLMVDGTRFLDPSLIRPGWVLLLPDPATATGADAGNASLDPDADDRTAPASGTADLVEPADVASGAPAAPRTLRPRQQAPDHTASQTRPAPATRPGPSPFPELVALGFGVLMAAALARRLRRNRRSIGRLANDGSGSDDTGSPDSRDERPTGEAVVDTATLIGRFGGAPVLAWLELANRHLGAVLAGVAAGVDVPSVRVLRVGPDGVVAWLATPVDWAPRSWVLGADGSTWTLPTSMDLDTVATTARDAQPWLPVVVSVGDDDAGSWLVPIEAGCRVPVLGIGAAEHVAAMALSAETWSWAEQLVVTDDPATAHREAALHGGDDGVERHRVLFVGDPEHLDPGDRSRCGVLTTRTVEPTDLTITVDQCHVGLLPLGVILRPHRLSPTRHDAVRSLLVEAAAEVDLDSGTIVEVSFPEATPAALGAGAIEVRLLTPSPRLDGLVDPLPVKRARRATELVAYLALHHPTPVTSDRLRTRVLGSGEVDAAAKTLFNTAGAARRSMGHDATGAPYLPPGAKTGHYAISPLVTVDVVRAELLVVEARRSDDPDAAMAQLRAALTLVEGEPLANVLSGYSWWSAEGHAGRTEALIEEAGCRLAELAAAAGLITLATWAVDQARKVAPFSEALSRAAIRVAAADGNVDQLRREWLECQRRIDEFDPGSLPTDETERLYVELTRRVAVA